MVTTKKEVKDQKPVVEIKQGENSSVTLPRLEHSGMPDGQSTTIRIADTIEIKETTIPGAKDIQRPLVVKNLESLYNAKDEDVPDIEVQASSAGAIIVSGYHRVNRAKARALYDYHVSKGTWPLDKYLNVPILDFDTISNVMRDADGKPREYTSEEQAVIDNTPVRVRFVNCKNVNELKRRIMRANNGHGQALSDNQKSKFAYLELVMAEEEGRKMTMRQAADMYGISHPSIISYRDSKTGKIDEAKRLSEKTGQTITPDQIVRGKVVETGSPSSPSSIPATATLTESEAAKVRDVESAKLSRAFFKSMRDLSNGVKGDSVDDIVTMLRSYVTKSDIETMRQFGHVLTNLAKRVEMDNAALESKQAKEAAEKSSGK